MHEFEPRISKMERFRMSTLRRCFYFSALLLVCHVSIHGQIPQDMGVTDRSILSRSSKTVFPMYAGQHSQDASRFASSSHRLLQAHDYASYVYTFKELYLFSYFNDTEIVVNDETGAVLWQGVLQEDSVQFLDLGEGVYRISGTKKYAVLIGDPVHDSTVGYFALDENSRPLSTKLLTFNPDVNIERWGDRAYFILWAYQDDTDVILSDLDTGEIIWSGTLHDGEYTAFQETTSERFLKIEATKPVSAQSYVDTGYFIPASNNTYSGRIFYVYSGGFIDWEGDLHGEDIQVIAYHNDTQVEIRELSGNPIWAGTLDEGEIHNEPSVYKKYLKVTSDKDVSVCSMPYFETVNVYHHLMLAQDTEGRGIGEKFFVPCIKGRLDFLAYENETRVVMKKTSDSTVVLDAMLNAFQHTTWQTTFDVYRVESSKPISIIESSGTHAGAEFVPLYYNVPAPIYPVTVSPQNAGDAFWVDVFVGDSTQPVNTLYGVAFAIHYDTQRTQLVLPLDENVELGEFLGDPDDVIFLHTPEDALAGDSLRLAATRTDGRTRSGWGRLFRVKFRTVHSTPDTTITFTLSSVTASDSILNPITLVTRSLSVDIEAKVTVWPGDTNDDGIVNQNDMLPIGLCWNRTGYPRSEYANPTAWEPQRCRPWPGDIRATFADANGDSVVNQNDVLVIGLNWNRRHEMDKRIPSLPVVAQERGSIKGRIIEEAEERIFHMNIELEDVTGLLGVGVEFCYPPDGMTVLSVEKADFFGKGSLFFHRDNAEAGKLGIAVTRINDEGGVSGSGCVATIRFRVNSRTDGSQITLGSATGMSETGYLFDLESMPVQWPETDDNAFDRPTSFYFHPIAPNPFNITTALRYEIPEPSRVMVTVYDVLGNEVAILVDQVEDAGRYNVVWGGRNSRGGMVSSGVYYFRLEAGAYTLVRKGLLLK